MPAPDSPPRQAGPRRWLRLALVPLDILVGLVVLLDEIARPLYRPLVRWFSGWRLVARIEAWIAGLPAYGVLAMFALPFAIAEPAKLLALVLMARGPFLPGLLLMGVAHLTSFLVVERIYHAGREKLLTIGWFASCMGLLVRIREAVLGRLRATAIWRRAVALAGSLREAGRAVRRWLISLRG